MRSLLGIPLQYQLNGKSEQNEKIACAHMVLLYKTGGVIYSHILPTLLIGSRF